MWYIHSFTWQNVLAPKGPSSVAKGYKTNHDTVYIDLVMNIYSITEMCIGIQFEVRGSI